MPVVSKRYTLSDIKKHQWFKKKVINKITVPNLSTSPIAANRKRQCVMTSRISSASQPVEFDVNPICNFTNDSVDKFSFSQPAHLENMILSTQMTQTGNSQNSFQRFVRRMTRFFTNVDTDTTINEIKELFERLNYSWKNCGSGQVR